MRFVPLAHGGHVRLHHGEPPPVDRQHVEDRSRVLVPFADHEDARAAGAVERLHDGLAAELLHEREDALAVVRDHRARHVAREVRRVELLVRVAEAARIVHDDGAVARPLEHLRQVEVRGVERRILADQDGVRIGEAHVLERAERRVRRGVAHRHRPNARVDVTVLQKHVGRLAVERHVPHLLSGALKRKRRVLVREDPIHRIHHVDESHPPTLAPALSCD